MSDPQPLPEKTPQNLQIPESAGSIPSNEGPKPEQSLENGTNPEQAPDEQQPDESPALAQAYAGLAAIDTHLQDIAADQANARVELEARRGELEAQVAASDTDPDPQVTDELEQIDRVLQMLDYDTDDDTETPGAPDQQPDQD